VRFPSSEVSRNPRPIQFGEQQFMTKEDFDYWKAQEIYAFGHHFGIEPEYGDSW
jgi:hypothetical protein